MLSFTKLNKDSKAIAVIVDKTKGKTKEVVFLTALKRGQKPNNSEFEERLEKYAASWEDNAFVLRNKYEFHAAPPEDFTPEYKRFVNYIVGKSGSGKSFYTSQFVEKYHIVHPDNKIFYVSNNPLSNDVSYSAELKEQIEEIDLNTVNSVIDFTNFKDCLFIFDDIIDCNISLDPEIFAQRLLEEKRNENPKSTKEVKLTVRETEYMDKLVLKQGQIVKKYIVDSIMNLLKLGRKNGISVVITDHKLYSGIISSEIISESHNVTLFPYVNVSNKKLKEFLMEKLSYDNDQADEILKKNKFYQFDFLTLMTQGVPGYITNNKIKLFL